MDPVKPELGVIPSGQENHSGAEHLNFPGGELNVIFLQSNISLKKIQTLFKFSWWRVIFLQSNISLRKNPKTNRKKKYPTYTRGKNR